MSGYSFKSVGNELLFSLDRPDVSNWDKKYLSKCVSGISKDILKHEELLLDPKKYLSSHGDLPPESLKYKISVKQEGYHILKRTIEGYVSGDNTVGIVKSVIGALPIGLSISFASNFVDKFVYRDGITVDKILRNLDNDFVAESIVWGMPLFLISSVGLGYYAIQRSRDRGFEKGKNPIEKLEISNIDQKTITE